MKGHQSNVTVEKLRTIWPELKPYVTLKIVDEDTVTKATYIHRGQGGSHVSESVPYLVS